MKLCPDVLSITLFALMPAKVNSSPFFKDGVSKKPRKYSRSNPLRYERKQLDGTSQVTALFLISFLKLTKPKTVDMLCSLASNVKSVFLRTASEQIPVVRLQVMISRLKSKVVYRGQL